MDSDSLLNRKQQITKRRSQSLEPEQSRRSLSRRRIPSESESDSFQRRRPNPTTVERERPRVPQKKTAQRKRNDSESSYSDESFDRRRDTKYSTTMIDKPPVSSAPVIKTTSTTDAICREISKQTSKSNLPVSLFDTSFQNTQDFLIKGPQALAKETKSRKLRVRRGGKTKRHI